VYIHIPKDYILELSPIDLYYQRTSSNIDCYLPFEEHEPVDVNRFVSSVPTTCIDTDSLGLQLKSAKRNL
jgi:hypothetical protein